MFKLFNFLFTRPSRAVPRILNGFCCIIKKSEMFQSFFRGTLIPRQIRHWLMMAKRNKENLHKTKVRTNSPRHLEDWLTWHLPLTVSGPGPSSATSGSGSGVTGRGLGAQLSVRDSEQSVEHRRAPAPAHRH